MKESYIFKIFEKTMSSNTALFFKYNPNESLGKEWITYLKNWKINNAIESKAHLFQFEVWSSSLDIKYWINGMFATVIGVLLMYYSISFADEFVNSKAYYDQYTSIVSQLSVAGLSSSQIASLIQQLNINESMLIAESDKTLYDFLIIVWVHLILSAYLIQNIMQYVFARLRYKNPSVIIPEFIVNLASTIITVYLLLIYYWYLLLYNYTPIPKSEN